MASLDGTRFDAHGIHATRREGADVEERKRYSRKCIPQVDTSDWEMDRVLQAGGGLHATLASCRRLQASEGESSGRHHAEVLKAENVGCTSPASVGVRILLEIGEALLIAM